MKISKCLVLGTFMLSSLAVSASGNGGGNGGDVLICKDNSGKVKSLQFLDVYEGREERRLKINLEANVSRKKHLQNIFNAHMSLNTKLMKSYMTLALELENQLSNLEKGGSDQPLVKFTTKKLLDVPDTGYLAIPEECNVEQLIVQQLDPLPGDKKYTFKKDYWVKLDVESQVAAIIHEVVLEDLVTRFQVKESSRARYINELILSKTLLIGADAEKEFEKLFFDLGFSLYPSGREGNTAPADFSCKVIIDGEEKITLTPRSDDSNFHEGSVGNYDFIAEKTDRLLALQIINDTNGFMVITSTYAPQADVEAPSLSASLPSEVMATITCSK